ncbi:hypothetical protein RND71_018939 [Anisodus tanguticus]|uniref:Uncharacterized protein n=1 Tax=Anisodus tanguticus TaxID=243964 RepID=A0AAE1VBG2_9SOLA|nr:hypothetical protein RND71_018939 [Anisodus tanguticus]
MEREVIEAELVLPTHTKFKKIQMYDKYPKGHARGRHWKHLKQIIQAENYPPDLPTSAKQHVFCEVVLKMKKMVWKRYEESRYETHHGHCRTKTRIHTPRILQPRDFKTNRAR